MLHTEAIRDPETRVEYIHRACLPIQSRTLVPLLTCLHVGILIGLQATHVYAKQVVKVITSATGKMPFCIRWIAREILQSLRVSVCLFLLPFSSAADDESFCQQRRFPEITDEMAALVLGRFIFLRVIKPAILCVPSTLTPSPSAI